MTTAHRDPRIRLILELGKCARVGRERGRERVAAAAELDVEQRAQGVGRLARVGAARAAERAHLLDARLGVLLRRRELVLRSVVRVDDEHGRGREHAIPVRPVVRVRVVAPMLAVRVE